jgi:hypothetical protein
MNGRRTAVGLSLLCALAFCAFAAQSASAQIGTKAKNTTAFTCVKGGGLRDFKDAHCDEFVGAEKGEFGHVAIPLNETTELEVTNSETANKTTEAASITIKTNLAGVSVEITCKTATTNGAAEKSFIHNVESEPKVHTATGTLAILLKDCEVKKPAKCSVKEPIEMKALFEGVEGLGPNKDTHGVEFKGDPDAQAPLLSITLQNNGPEPCALAGKTVGIFGTMIATGTPSPKDKHSGATTRFEPGNEMQTLTAGGKAAEFTATFTMRMKESGGIKQNPIALTTVT